MIMVDTDILIWVLRGKEDVKEKFITLVESTNGMMFITPIQIAEIHSGLLKSEKRRTEMLLDSLVLVDIDKNIGELSGELMKKYRKSHNVTLADSLIAATTIKNSLKIWTLNKKHYPMFKDKEFVA